MSNEIEKLKRQIAKLPRGYISNKNIRGKMRHYRQWTENGKIKSEYISDDNYETIRDSIAIRKELEKKLKALNKEKKTEKSSFDEYEMNVITGNALQEMVAYVKGWEKRECYSMLETYLYGKVTPRVCSVYGLRRTGKTTLLHQAIGSMNEENFSKAAYVKARKTQTMSMLDRDLRKLYQNGFRYIFIDEITFIEDFVDTASFLSDIYAAMGMKIVLSGTDSLGLWFATHEELYDRTYTIHTTWIPYSEHARLLGIGDVDEYIRYGGTLRVGETDFDDEELRNEEVSFRDNETTRRYIDTAICGNIQHSLKCYESGTHFRHLQKLYENNELNGAINRVIENMNHRFVLKVLTDDFNSGDLELSRKNMLRERNPALRIDVLDRIDTAEVTERLMEIFDIRNKADRSVELADVHVSEIREYLQALELIENYPVRYAGANNEDTENILFTQPGMRYCQAQALVFSLKKDRIFAELNPAESDYVCSSILDEIKGRMLEEIVLYETIKKMGTQYEVFKLVFAAGEFDMVVYDKENHICRIYEIKHSTEAVPEQCRHLIDSEKCGITGNRFGTIASKSVLYRGESMVNEQGIEYVNVSCYLKEL